MGKMIPSPTTTSPCRHSSRMESPLVDPQVHNPALASAKDLLGVSVHHFVQVFLPAVLASGYSTSSQFLEIENFRTQDSFVRQQGATTTCPVDARMGAAYVHTLVGDDHVGPSTAMLSWTWKYTVGSVVETLEDYCLEHGLNPKRTYIWMCCLCVNQHRVVQSNNSGMLNKSDMNFENEFRRRVLGIGKLLAMMGPWDDPEYLKRVWCIFECFTAIQNGVEITIVMPPKERERMSKILLGSSDRRSRRGNGSVVTAGTNAHAVATTTDNTPHPQEPPLASPEDESVFSPSDAHALATAENAATDKAPHPQEPPLASPEDDPPVMTCTLQHPSPCRGGVDALYRALANISVQQAQATVPEDQTRIMGILQQSQIGVDAVNKQVANYLREWVRRAIDVIVQQQEERVKHAAMNDESKRDCQEKTRRRYRLTHAAFCTNVAMIYQRNGEYDAAIHMYQKSHDIYVSEWGNTHAYTAATLCNIGSVLMAQGRHEQALKMHHQALEIQKALPKPQQKNMATTYANLAQAWHGRGDFDKALKMYEKAAVISERFYGTDHQATAPIYSSIGSCLLLQGKHSDALVYFQKALEVFKVEAGENHPDTAKTYGDIGRTYHGQGKYAESLVMQDKAIAIQETMLGNHVDTATSHLNKARSLQAKGDYQAALTAYRKTRGILVKSNVGRMHPTTAATFCSLGSLYQAMKKYSKSLEMYSKALKYHEVACPHHFSTARVYSDIGSVLHDRNEARDQQKALAFLQRARAIQEASLNPFHPTLATTYLNLGRVMKAHKGYDEALAMYQKALKIQEKVLGVHHPTTASTYSSVASLLVVQNHRPEALSMYQKCLTIQMEVLGTQHPMTVKTQHKMKKV